MKKTAEEKKSSTQKNRNAEKSSGAKSHSTGHNMRSQRREGESEEFEGTRKKGDDMDMGDPSES